MILAQAAFAALCLVICIVLIVNLVKGKALIQKVNQIIMEANVEDKTINYNRLIRITLVLLCTMIVLTGINTYLYVKDKKLGDPPAFSVDTSQVVNVNVNTPGNTESDKLDLNTASREDLEALDGVGEILACRIIEARPFYNIEQLKDVEGIGDTKLNYLRGYVEVVRYD